ncbi:hypothetical protein I316_06421 [Kwoniella heveanensis BCC8398]|uniref:Uncharacterized protein n=1 Tax=Kwoniella heveanensis BCC8398 TaxID=1296120 RepID=A0A1B9GLH0_9TREE|nr:hypothetical protein I316_06421 [Kwoniella heveanensis BCC8398]
MTDMPFKTPAIPTRYTDAQRADRRDRLRDAFRQATVTTFENPSKISKLTDKCDQEDLPYILTSYEQQLNDQENVLLDRGLRGVGDFQTVTASAEVTKATASPRKRWVDSAIQYTFDFDEGKTITHAESTLRWPGNRVDDEAGSDSGMLITGCPADGGNSYGLQSMISGVVKTAAGAWIERERELWHLSEDNPVLASLSETLADTETTPDLATLVGAHATRHVTSLFDSCELSSTATFEHDRQGMKFTMDFWGTAHPVSGSGITLRKASCSVHASIDDNGEVHTSTVWSAK